MRRRAVIAPIVLAAAAVLAWRRQRARVRASLDAAPAAHRVIAPDAPAPIAPPQAAGRALAAPAPPASTPPALTAPVSPPDSRFVSVPWTLVAAPDDRAELTIRHSVDPRLELDRVDAQETPTQVFVTVLMRPRAAAGEREAPIEEREATLPLSSTLGTRALIHAPTDVPASSGGEPSGPASVYP